MMNPLVFLMFQMLLRAGGGEWNRACLSGKNSIWPDRAESSVPLKAGLARGKLLLFSPLTLRRDTCWNVSLHPWNVSRPRAIFRSRRLRPAARRHRRSGFGYHLTGPNWPWQADCVLCVAVPNQTLFKEHGDWFRLSLFPPDGNENVCLTLSPSSGLNEPMRVICLSFDFVTSVYIRLPILFNRVRGREYAHIFWSCNN